MGTAANQSEHGIKSTEETKAELSNPQEVSDLINGATVLGITIAWIMLVASLTDSAQSALTHMSDATELALGAAPGYSLHSINMAYWCNVVCITAYVIIGMFVIPAGFIIRYWPR